MIQVEHLTKRFGEVTAVDDVSFEVEKGRILGFIGKNGAGKTTTMRILAGFFPASEGRASVAGFDVYEQPLLAKKHVGYLPEHPPLYPEMTVDAFLRFAATIKGVPRSEVAGRVAYVKERCGLQDWGHRLIKHLSKGFRQRVGVAQALVHDPPVLILDEPMVGLDPEQIIEVRKLIKSLAGDHTVMLSTHTLSEVSMACDKVVIIREGKIAAIDTPDNLTVRRSGEDLIQIDLKSGENRGFDELAQLIETLQDVRGVSVESLEDGMGRLSVSVLGQRDLRPLIAKTAIESGFDLYQLTRQKVSLEEAFLELTADERTDADGSSAESGEAA